MIMDYIKENMQTNYKGVTETEGVYDKNGID